MTSPDLPAELKAALDGKLRGFSRNDAAGRAASISKTYRDGGGSGAHPVGNRCAGLRAGADARDLCRGHGQPERAGRDQAGLRARTACSISAPGRERRPGRPPKPFRRCKDFALLDANDALRALALDLARDSTRLRDISYERGEARAALAKADAADLVMASYVIGEIGDAERRALAELMWEKTRDTLLVVEPGTPAGYARIIALREQLDRAGRACRRALPA